MPPDNQTPFQPNQPTPTVSPDYGFIMEPAKPPRGGLLNNSSMAVRIAVILGGLLLLLVLFVIFKNLLSSKPKLDSYVTVAQDQQELIHLSTNSAQQQDLSTNNQNLASTAQLSLSSGQAQVVKYLANNGLKAPAKTLGLKVSKSLDQQLVSAEAAGTYNQTFQSIMKNQLNTYMNDMKLAYNQNKGKKGRALLNNQYTQATLLLQQASTPANQ